MPNSVDELPRSRWRRQKLDVVSFADRARDAQQWELAAQLYREALDRDPRNSPIWVQYGHALKEWGELSDPDKLAYRRALSLDPGGADTYLQLGHVLKLQGRIEKAQAAYLRAFAVGPSLDSASFELAELGWSEAHFDELRTIFGMGIASPIALSGVDGTPHAQPTMPVAHPQTAGRKQYESKFQRVSENRPGAVLESSDHISGSSLAYVQSEDYRLVSQSRLFDEAWYLENQRDVKDAGLDPLLHYLGSGAKEGRDPHPLFDSDWYLAENPDVAAAGINPLVHYLRSGATEGRCPHPLFDTAWYLKTNQRYLKFPSQPIWASWSVG